MIPELRKLGIAPEQRILLRHSPKAFLEELKSRLMPGSRLTTRFSPRAKYDLIFDWLSPDVNLNEFFERMQNSLVQNGALWVIIPNQRAAKARGVRYNWNAIIAAALKTKLVDNKTLSFSTEEYGTRFVIRRVFRNREP